MYVIRRLLAREEQKRCTHSIDPLIEDVCLATLHVLFGHVTPMRLTLYCGEICQYNFIVLLQEAVLVMENQFMGRGTFLGCATL